MPALLRNIAVQRLRQWYPLEWDIDSQPPQTVNEVVFYMSRFGLLDALGLQVAEARTRLAAYTQIPPQVDSRAMQFASPLGKVRLPAQWETLESVLLSWPVMYPQLWPLHAQMAEAISVVADATIIVPAPMWAAGVRLFLQQRGLANMARVRFVSIPVDDIWVRDYGPFVGLDGEGRQVTIDAIFDPLEQYPQRRDDAMPQAWAVFNETPYAPLNLHLEGGNVWSDGEGTLIMADQLYYSNPHLSYEGIEAELHRAIDFEKLIVIPRLESEETGHVDLVTKLADRRTILVSAPNGGPNDPARRRGMDILRRSTNALGESYEVVELPSPPVYYNWFVWPVWRSYTNALTVNGRVLVPTFGIEQDEIALATYRRAMPDHAIIPIDCSVSSNGGGAVHCLTKEVPAGKF